MPVRHILNVTHSPIDHVATDFFRLERRYHGLPAAHRPHIQTLIESATAQFVRAMKDSTTLHQIDEMIGSIERIERLNKALSRNQEQADVAHAEIAALFNETLTSAALPQGRQTPAAQLAREAAMRTRNGIVTAAPSPAEQLLPDTSAQRHYTTADLAALWNKHPQTILRLARKQKEGVLWLGETRKTPSISESAKQRIYVRLQGNR